MRGRKLLLAVFISAVFAMLAALVAPTVAMAAPSSTSSSAWPFPGFPRDYRTDTLDASEIRIPRELLPHILRVPVGRLEKRLEPAISGIHNGQWYAVRARYAHLARVGVRLEDLAGIRLDSSRLAALRLSPEQLRILGLIVDNFTPSLEAMASLTIPDFAYLGPEGQAKVLDYYVDWRELVEIGFSLRRNDLEDSLGANTTLRDFRRIGIDFGQLFTVHMDPRELARLGLTTADWLRLGLLPPGLKTGGLQLQDLRKIGWTLDSVKIHLEGPELAAVAGALHAQKISAEATERGLTGPAIPLDTLLSLCQNGPGPDDSCSVDLRVMDIHEVFPLSGKLAAKVGVSRAASVQPRVVYDARGAVIHNADDSAQHRDGRYFRECGKPPCLAEFFPVEGQTFWRHLSAEGEKAIPRPAGSGYLALAIDVDNLYSISEPDWNVSLEFRGRGIEAIAVDTVKYSGIGRNGIGRRPWVALLLALPAGTHAISGFQGYNTRYPLRDPLAVRVDSERILSLGEWDFEHGHPGSADREAVLPSFRRGLIPTQVLERLALKQGITVDYRNLATMGDPVSVGVPAPIGADDDSIPAQVPKDILRPMASWVAGFSMGYPQFLSMETGVLLGIRPRDALYQAVRLTGEATPFGVAAHAGFMERSHIPRDFFGTAYCLGMVWAWDRAIQDGNLQTWTVGPEAAFILGQVGLRLAIPAWPDFGVRAGVLIHMDGVEED